MVAMFMFGLDSLAVDDRLCIDTGYKVQPNVYLNVDDRLCIDTGYKVQPNVYTLLHRTWMLQDFSSAGLGGAGGVAEKVL